MYSIPPEPARWRGHQMDSTNEALMMCDLEQRGVTGLVPHPTRFASARWGLWKPDAVCTMLTSAGWGKVYWEFKPERWLQGKVWGNQARRMLSAYEDTEDCWAVIAQRDGWMRLVLLETDGTVGLRKVAWSETVDGKLCLNRVHLG